MRTRGETGYTHGLAATRFVGQRCPLAFTPRGTGVAGGNFQGAVLV
jgi:hypothetical protein